MRVKPDARPRFEGHPAHHFEAALRRALAARYRGKTHAVPEISGTAFAANVGTPNPVAMPAALCAKKERRDNFITDPPFLSIPFILFQIVVE